MTADESKVLVRYDQRSIFRHSTVAKFSVVFETDLTKEYKISNGEELRLCTFSPKGDSLIFIDKNNTIYYINDDGLKSGKSPKRASNYGTPNVIYNGIPDWVYEEEVLGSDAAAWFSPDGNYLAYASFDDTNVREYMYEIYGDGKGEFQYPREVHLRYPKVIKEFSKSFNGTKQELFLQVGDNNPKVELLISNVQSSQIQWLPLGTPTEIVTDDHILGTVFWISDKKVGAIWLNRRQNKGVIVSYRYVDDFSWEMEVVGILTLALKIASKNLINK